MNCPVCKEPMAILEYEEVEVDCCLECGGMWLDAGELELLFGERQMAADFLGDGDSAQTSEAPRKCPICRKPMEKRATRGTQPVLYDHCPRQDGQWFDKGELASVLAHGSAAPGGEAVIAWLRALFSAPEP